MIYVDTSVLGAYYCPEPLSGRAQQILQEESELAISSLVEVDLASALAMKVRKREMRLGDARRVQSVFQNHLDQGFYIRLAVERAHFVQAYNWLTTFTISLRTLDALHLAIAATQDCPFLTADISLAGVGTKVGLTVRLVR